MRTCWWISALSATGSSSCARASSLIPLPWRVPPVAALQGGALVVHFTNRKNAPLLFSTRPGTRPKRIAQFAAIQLAGFEVESVDIPSREGFEELVHEVCEQARRRGIGCA